MGKTNLNRELTLVIKITDPAAAAWIWEAHKKPGINGIAISIIADGDQVTTPGEITEALVDIDPAFPKRSELEALVFQAEKHLKLSH